MCTLEKEVQVLPGIGEKRAALFHRLGINTLHDILHFFPRDYEDFTQAIPISQAALGQIVCVLVTVTALPTESFSRKGVRLCKVSAADESSTLEVVFFNNPYAGRLLKKGKKYYLRGRIGGTNFKRNIISPECVSADENPGLRPVYATTAGLTSRLISTTVRAALSFCAKNPIQDPLSTPLRETYRLCSLCYV
ncbi:MAG TPA: ATP-dependent DNA helicase RecG, partial [Ruminococcaceae bacterium]|nr:ATP-dependent DNA helicase RecG [Oscillospiraceae bacterium]